MFRHGIRHRSGTAFGAVSVTVLTMLGVAQPASAVTAEQKLSVLSSWTQTGVSSYDAWYVARNDQEAWTSYAFDWSTDYCTDSPDNPLGFDFRLPCARHDFGYRNYKAVGGFAASKSRIDSYFYADLTRRCATYASILRPACDALAWVYYQAVKEFGSVVVSTADLNRARALLPGNRSSAG